MSGKSKHTNETESSEPRETRTVRRLRAQLDEAQDIHQLTANPLLAAVQADRFRVSVTRSMWCFLTCGLGFTATGVQAFLAGHLGPSDPMWWGAWLVEPAFAGILITLLRWEAQMLSHGLAVDDRPVKWLKRVLLGATLVTNVWSSLRPPDGQINAGMVFLHLVIPLVVFLLAEVMPVIQQRCNAARDLAAQVVAPVPTKPVAAPAPVRSAVRLPGHLQGALDAKANEVRAQGRALTAQDVQDALNVPEDYAERIAAQLAA
ncbi:hypothetical protein SK854_21370 [Lentzea sp. BCCO 10_0061]|uniref:DUF2637 domain-containing protein n=1 Tax=Lentzea sokolovensis TaxID=3095429 RepID=A0ABU4UYT7_9PSEU|nr:hypothetical protein [Lentzea sp. BCCO 10_0061]MDX8144681.1 hypothetical protein [Lentzea sp. BCCO 10_0061]